ncbi:hypothetical protein LQ327_01435 [Actinomycetospora endophytica]|uniref:Uncharacterized protein n=1 Tax=Actinomycetospora endophytica TaxID=2291215 RepID=A0ABS8P1B8_9PSEU|nr:hypothetical protein [Actinomycetospora endophytica]MCD2192053.1 hypothetical protein [Actinomycetospora endophytica]
MSIGRVVGWIVVLLVLYAIITQPTQSAATTSNLASGLAHAGQQTIVFIQSVATSFTGGSTSTSYSQTHGVPSGGVSTGDGSYP